MESKIVRTNLIDEIRTGVCRKMLMSAGLSSTVVAVASGKSVRNRLIVELKRGSGGGAGLERIKDALRQAKAFCLVIKNYIVTIIISPTDIPLSAPWDIIISTVQGIYPDW